MVQKKKRKNPGQEQEKKSISNHRPREKEKIFGSKRMKRPTSSDPLKKNQGIRSQWSKENQKTLRESCNATITKVLNTRQWSQL